MTYPFTPIEKWDVHTHTIFAPDTWESLARFAHHADFIRVRAHGCKPCCAELVDHRGVVQRAIEQNAYDGPTRLAECDGHGVTMQVLSPTPMMIPDYIDQPADAAEICRILNDGNAAIVAQFPRRFVALGVVPMMHADHAVKELERIHGTLGMRGIEINSNVHGLDLDDPRFLPIFETAAHMGLAIFIHPWGGFMAPAEERLRNRMNAGYNWRPWLIAMGMETALAFDALRSGGIHERFPKLPVLYAHGGGVFPALLGRLEHGAYSRPDLFRRPASKSPYETVQECGVYVDTLTHDPWVLEMLIQALGTQRIAMGSDYPYPLGEMDTPGAMTRGGISKGIYPGHMIEHLPESENDLASAWQHFHWLARENADGRRRLPCLTEAQKNQLLYKTAQEWLGYRG
jgi:aminocarboxymuconate-semialdehyde decarboxylase